MALVGEHFLNLQPYKAGKPISETKRELGIDDIIKLASNENCYGPSPKVKATIKQLIGELEIYPDSAAFQLKAALADFYREYQIQSNQIVVGNGADELINMAVRTFMLPGEEAINCWPTFPSYHLKLQAAGATEKRLPMGPDFTFDVDQVLAAVTPKTKLVFVTNPNNPSGTIMGKAAFHRLVTELPPEVILFVDEAYGEYVISEDYPDSLPYLQQRQNLIICRTFSKIYGLAGLRVGYLFTDPLLADYLNRGRDPFNVNAIGQLAAIAALSDQEHTAYCRQKNSKELAFVKEGLANQGLKYWPALANFILVDFGQPVDPIFKAMLKKGVIIRAMTGNGLATCGRITIGTREQNIRMLNTIREVLHAS